MVAYVWLEGNFVLLLHEASLHVKSDRFLALNNSALKVVSRKNRIIRITQRWFVHFFLSHSLFCRYISSKVKPLFVEDIKMAPGFGRERQYVGKLNFMCQVTSKIRFDVLLGGGCHIAVTFSIPKSIYEWAIMPSKIITFLLIGGNIWRHKQVL